MGFCVCRGLGLVVVRSLLGREGEMKRVLLGCDR